MNESIKTILENNPVGVLATINGDCSPLATPLHLMYDNQFVYWLSSVKADHSKNIANCAKISLSIWSPDESNGLVGLFIQAKAETLSGNDSARAVQKFAERFDNIPPALQSANAYRVRLGDIDTAKTNGGCIYLK